MKIPLNTYSLRDIEIRNDLQFKFWHLNCQQSQRGDIQTIVAHSLWDLHVCQWVFNSKKYLISFQMEFIHSGCEMLLFSSTTALVSLIDRHKMHCMEDVVVLSQKTVRYVHAKQAWSMSPCLIIRLSPVSYFISKSKKVLEGILSHWDQRQRSQEDWCCV